MILMPKVISNACLLLKSNLTSTQLGNCTLFSQRVYDRIDTIITGIGPMTGANMLDSATSVLNLGLLTDNTTIVKDALNHFYNQTLITPGTGVDGVKIDGSYLQHGSQLYNGNYGKDFINSVVVVYSQTANTSFAPPPESQSAFSTLMNGTEWMIISNQSTNLLWEYSVIGRMVSFIAADKQASGGVALNLTRIQQSTANWENPTSFQHIVQDLTRLNKSASGGQGNLKGTRGFFTSDYLVHRSPSYVTTWKSFSTRTSNSECNNAQNPFGFHLSDGSIFSYIDGNEYADIFAAWDWNLVPGTTVDYGATPFGCNTTQFYGNTSFVGSVTYGEKGGMAVMQYLNPMTGSLRWEKTFYFFPGFYAVQIGTIYSQTTAPIVTTLDQSNLKGDVYVNGKLFGGGDITATSLVNNSSSKSSATTLWHNKILYTILDNTVSLQVNTASHSANNWSAIGISQGQANQRIFTATLQHPPAPLLSTDNVSRTAAAPPVSYIAQLNTESKANNNPNATVQLVYQDDDAFGKVSGAYNPKDQTIALAFWTAGTYTSPWGLTVKTDQPILTFFTTTAEKKKGKGYNTITVSDPTQLLAQVNINITQHHGSSRLLNINLPTSPMAGSSISFTI
jgi:hypothetical protein